MSVKIRDRYIGDGQPHFIIAEAGANANSDIRIAFSLIDGAVEAGADCIKFQHYKAEDLVTKNAPKYYVDTMSEWENGERPKGYQYEEFKLLDKLTFDDWKKIKTYCDEKGIIFLSTPFDFNQVDILAELEVDAYKIASADINYFQLLEYVGKKRKPIILSTGASTLEEIREAVRFIQNVGCNQLCLLQCTLHYPCRADELNLNVMDTLKKEFPECEVGLSDHSLGITGPIVAAAMGARIIEKHYTIDKTLAGSTDHFMSVGPGELKNMVKAIRSVELIRGSKYKAPLASEKEAILYARRSIVSMREIPAGKTINTEDIAIKRPGTGISPRDIDKVVGKKAKKNIPQDIPIEKDMIDLENVS